MAAQVGELSTFSVISNESTTSGLGDLFFEKNLKRFKKLSKNQKFDYSEGHNVMCTKDLGLATDEGEFFIFVENKKSDLRGVVIDKNKKKSKNIGQIFPHRLLRRL